MIHTKPARANRRRAGLSIAATRGAVTQIAVDQWQVASQSGYAPYTVTLHTNLDDEQAWECDCPDHRHRESECKHIQAAQHAHFALDCAVQKFIAGELDQYSGHLARALVADYLVDTEADHYTVLWLATEAIRARARVLR